MPGASTTLPLSQGLAVARSKAGALPEQSLRTTQRPDLPTRQPIPSLVDARSASLLTLAWISALFVALPVFVQAPWVREAPVGATLFTGPILVAGLLLHWRAPERWRPLGALLVGFAGSWLGGAIFWGWFRDQPLWHLPIEAFALPLALGGWRTPWRLSCAFYMGSLAGTACTDGVMALSGVIHRWPLVVNASLEQAPLLLHQAALSLLHPLPLLLILAAATLLLLSCLRLWRAGEGQRIAAAALGTTLVVDGLFLGAALVAPRLSGLI